MLNAATTTTAAAAAILAPLETGTIFVMYRIVSYGGNYIVPVCVCVWCILLVVDIVAVDQIAN